MATAKDIQAFLKLGSLLSGKKIIASTICGCWIRHLPDGKRKDGILFCTSRGLRYFGPPAGLPAPGEYIFTLLYENIRYDSLESREPRAEDDTDVGGFLGDYRKYSATLIVEGVEPTRCEGRVVRNYGESDRTRWQVMIEKGHDLAYSEVLQILDGERHRRSTSFLQTTTKSMVAAPTAGSVLAGRLTLVRKLGAGANGAVWEAVDQTGVRQAIKLFHERLEGEEVARISKEIAIASRLQDPGLVRYFSTSLEDAGDQQFIRMELVQGRSIRDIVNWTVRGRNCTLPSLPDVIRWATGCLRPLKQMHSVGVIHRDLHAGNVMICDDGSIKLVDYGSARIRKESDGNSTFAVPGAATYAAPEKLENPSLAGPASDYFSLGVMLYLLATGRLPFWQDSLVKLIRQVEACEYVSARVLRPEIPGWLDSLIDLLLLKDSKARWSDPDAISDLLGTAALDEGKATAKAREVLHARLQTQRESSGRSSNPYDLTDDALRMAEWLYQHDKDGMPYQLASVEQAGSDLGLDHQRVQDATSELADQGLAKYKGYMSGAKVAPTHKTPFAIPEHIDYDPEEDILIVAKALTDSGSWQKGNQLAHATNLPIGRLNRAVLFMKDTDLADVKMNMGTVPYAFGLIQPTHRTRKFVKDALR